MRRPLLAAAVLVAVILAVSHAMASPGWQSYDHMASDGYASSTTDARLVTSNGTLYVRSIRIEVVGLQSSDGWLSGRFACWYTGSPIVIVDSVQFNAGPEPNDHAIVESFEYPPDYYPKGLPAPADGSDIDCGFEAPGMGQDPPVLVAGFARVRLLFKEG